MSMNPLPTRQKGTIRRIGGYMRRYWPQLISSVILAALAVALTHANSMNMKKMFKIK